MNESVALVALAGCLASAVARPRWAPDWAVAPLAALALLIGGVLSAHQARLALRTLGPTIGFLAALLIVAEGCARAGLFDAAGASMARALGDGPAAVAGPGVRSGRADHRGAQPRRHGAAAHAGRVRDRGPAASQSAPARVRLRAPGQQRLVAAPCLQPHQPAGARRRGALVHAFRRPHGAAVAGGAGCRVGGSHARVRRRPAPGCCGLGPERVAPWPRFAAIVVALALAGFALSSAVGCGPGLDRGDRRGGRWPRATG